MEHARQMPGLESSSHAGLDRENNTFSHDRFFDFVFLDRAFACLLLVFAVDDFLSREPFGLDLLEFEFDFDLD
jgi:hypothetical protein